MLPFVLFALIAIFTLLFDESNRYDIEELCAFLNARIGALPSSASSGESSTRIIRGYISILCDARVSRMGAPKYFLEMLCAFSLSRATGPVSSRSEQHQPSNSASNRLIDRWARDTSRMRCGIRGRRTRSLHCFWHFGRTGPTKGLRKGAGRRWKAVE